MAKYTQLAGFISNLVAKLGDNDADLPVHEPHIALLRQRLGADGYTYLRITDGTVIEYVKLSAVNDALRLERGLEDTTPHTFPVGSCVAWEITPSAVRDIVCQMPCC